MKICVLVKEVPDAAVEKSMDSNTKRLDRSGEKNLNPFDTHAIEAAMQVKEGGQADVEEIVAVTMGPESAVRALHKAVSLGADRSVHLSDDSLAGSDVAATEFGMLAGMIDDPQVLAAVRAFQEKWMERMLDGRIDRADAWMVRLAADGLWYADLLGLAAPRGDDRRALLARLLTLARGGTQ